MKIQNKKGFSLVEVMVVVVIVAILAAVSIPFYQRSILRSHAAEVNNLLTMVRTRQSKKFAQDKQFATLFTDPLLKKIALGPDDYEENTGATKTVNSDYVLRLRTNEAKDLGCVTGTYSPGGEDKFTFAISYTQSGLGCTDAPDSSYSVCKSFGDTVVGSVDDVCSLQAASGPVFDSGAGGPPQPNFCDTLSCPVGTEIVDCQCVECKEKPKPGYQFAKGCDWEPCKESCKEGFHYVEGCKCEADSSSCDPCPGDQILVDNDSCKCACPEKKPIWDEASQQCIKCKEPTTWDPKVSKCMCPSKTPVLIEDAEEHIVKCVKCEEAKPNSVWNSQKQICECSCSGGRIVLEDKEDQEECNCVCPSQTPIWDAEKQQCISCSDEAPFYDEVNKTCLTCYDKYGDKAPVWSPEIGKCISCYDKFPGRVVCSGGSGFSREATETNDRYNKTQSLTDYSNALSSINSYAAKTGALLAAGNVNEGKCGARDSHSEVYQYIETPQCTSSSQHTPCRYTCVPLGLSNIEGLVDSCGATLANGGMDTCTCDPGVGWVCPNQCELITGDYWTVEIPTQACEMSPSLSCTPNLTGWITQGSCQDTWHNAKEYEPARPVWVPNSSYASGGYCASCGQVRVMGCSSSATCGGTTYDHFSGKVWNGERCVNLPVNYYLESQQCVSIELIPVAKCYSHAKDCQPACYWNKNSPDSLWSTTENPICQIGSEHYQVFKKDLAAADVRNMLTSSSSATIKQVYRQSYNKDYYALTRLNIAPNVKKNVITE